MSCYSPLIGIPDINPRTNKPYLTKNGKTKYRIIKSINNKDSLNDIFDYKDSILIPCGKCIGCRLDYSRQWANRLMLENKYHEESYFVTLTYNDEFVPRSGKFIDGEYIESLSLCKRDVQLFFKRLRKMVSEREDGNGRIRFFASGEYGSNTFRPHYHAIIFGLHLDDLEFLKKSPLGYNYYRSPFLERAWSSYERGVKESRTTLTRRKK